ncbi:ABC transporter substrate-binding protein [Trichocoleus sp. FACHB-591]|uniref:ABC transporter substrate-binding protein n=1 Tax=Trichocoleus sp. FACHB-591 TaxID=2692872 RepID=UPI0016869C45|nr:ABC transporter substrate-binding protein [Trichocoleus sp. FACHB-591]MBD2095777.1 ABC transporter substrate-binding protein [Trichocoleus sp. FACHB-591]
MIHRLGRRKFLNHFLTSLTTYALVVTAASCSSQQSQINSTAIANTAPATSSVAKAGDQAVLRVGFISTESRVPLGPEGWAHQKGWWNQELKSLGIQEVRFVPFDGGPALNEALSSGALDLGLYGDTPALVGRSAGLPTKLINQTRVGQDAWLLTKQDGVRSLADLKGKKVGVAKGTYLHRYLIGLLEENKLTSDVKIIQMKPAEAKVAIERGDIAAYPFAMGVGPTLLEQGFRAIDQASTHDDLVGTGVSIVTEAALAKYPELPKQWNQTRQKALADIKANSEAFYQFAAKESGGLSLSAAKASYPLNLYPTEPFNDRGLQLLNSTKDFLAEQQLLKSDFDIKDWQAANP